MSRHACFVYLALCMCHYVQFLITLSCYDTPMDPIVYIFSDPLTKTIKPKVRCIIKQSHG